MLWSTNFTQALLSQLLCTVCLAGHSGQSYNLGVPFFKKSYLLFLLLKLDIITNNRQSVVSCFEAPISLKNYCLNYCAQSESNKKRAEGWILCFDKSKESPICSIILRQFLVIFLTPTFISFTKLKIRWSFWGAEQV